MLYKEIPQDEKRIVEIWNPHIKPRGKTLKNVYFWQTLSSRRRKETLAKETRLDSTFKLSIWLIST